MPPQDFDPNLTVLDPENPPKQVPNSMEGPMGGRIGS